MAIDARIDLTSGFNGLFLSTLAVRNAAIQYVSGGGFYGQGSNLFIPGDDGAGGEQYCGLGQFVNVNTAGDSRRGSIGILHKFRSNFWTAQPSDIKFLILIRGGLTRPMIISKKNGGGGTRVLGACYGTVCNTRDFFPADNHNDGSNEPDIEDYNNVWCWTEHQWDTIDGELRTKLWTSDGVVQGAGAIQDMPDAASDEVDTIDIIGFINSTASGDANNGYEVEYVDCRIGSDADITPPPGFPGSNSSNWTGL